MTKEDKQLLIKDLCARLPYGVKVGIRDCDYPSVVQAVYSNLDVLVNDICRYSLLEECFIYLRPMSDMTEEEIKDYYKCTDAAHRECYEVRANGEDRRVVIGEDGYSSAIDLDWLNSHHFDYRGLIEKGLALTALEGMYKTE